MLVLIAGCDTNKKKVAKNNLKENNQLEMVYIGSVLGRVEEDETGAIGLPRISGYLKDERKTKNVLLFDTGDLFYGSKFVEASEGESAIEVANKLKITAMTTGVQDYAYGLDRIKAIESKLNFPIVASNVKYNDNDENVFKSFVIKNINGLKVGIIGVVNPDIKFRTRASNTKDIKFTNPKEAVKKAVKRLKDRGVDYIVVLSSLGVDTKYSSIKLAKEVKGINLIVDGHYLKTILKSNYKVGNTLISNCRDYLNNLRKIEVNFDKKGNSTSESKLIPKRQMVKIAKKDDEIKEIIDRYNKLNLEDITGKVGRTSVDLIGDRNTIGMEETNLGDAVTDAILKETGADFVLVNSGAIRSSILKGDITVKRISEVLPFLTTNAILEVTGQNILDALENGIRFYPRPATRFPQIAGFRFTFDPNRAPGHRVIELTTTDGKKISMTKKYKMATNGFIIEGGDQYTSFHNAEATNKIDYFQNIFRRYITEKSVLSTKIDGRISTVFQKESLKK